MPNRGPILLVEDNAPLAQLVVRRLGRMGWRMIVATRGDEGLALARSAVPAAVLLDMSLPGLDGWAVAEALRAHPDTRHLPILALTAHAFSSDRQRALAAGCNAFHTKPIDFAALDEWLRSVVPAPQ